MTKVLVTGSVFTDIANAIRAKLGVQTTYKPSQMATAIGAITGVSASDNGKVVVNGELAAQTSKSVSSNGTYDTTTNNEVVVSVPTTANLGTKTITQNGTYLALDDSLDGYSSVVIQVVTGEQYPVSCTVTGGYNGGAVVNVNVGTTQIFAATASDTYNRNYNNTTATQTIGTHTFSVTLTPPSSNTGNLYIEVDFDNGADTHTFSIKYTGNNTSYGYNYSDSHTFYA